jgi:HSP20 family protein
VANISRYDPFGDLFDDLVKGFFVRPVTAEGAGRQAIGRVNVEVSEQNGAYKVTAEVPGVKKEDIQVTIDGDQVTIAAEVKKEKDVKEGERIVHSERYYGKVSRSFRLGQDIDQGGAQAKYENGVLELVLPKRQTATARQLEIS